MVSLPQGLIKTIAPVSCSTIDMDEYFDLDNGTVLMQNRFFKRPFDFSNWNPVAGSKFLLTTGKLWEYSRNQLIFIYFVQILDWISALSANKFCPRIGPRSGI
jgi:hypothetical protein